MKKSNNWIKEVKNMTEVEYEKVIVEVPAYILQKTGTGQRISECISDVQCECHLETIPAVVIEASTDNIKIHPA